MKANRIFKIYILEDDRWYGAMLEHHLSLNPNYQVSKFENEQAFFKAMIDVPDIVTLEYSMTDMDRSQALKRIQHISPQTAVLITSG